eukprot:scaffold39718_cov62-Cyclotella_meneghiniana.AAC.1
MGTPIPISQQLDGLIVSNDETRLRLEFIVCNGRNNLTFESLVGTILALAHEISTFHTKNPYHSSLTVPLSPYEYNE